jgi:putative transposase
MRPNREHATNNGQTYMVTSSTWGRHALFQKQLWARLLIDTLYHYRGSAYLLHEFVVMPDHIHVLLTPKTSLEKAMQFIKGGFSYRAKKEMGSNMEIWQKGFSDHRIRDPGDYSRHVSYVRENPVRKHLCDQAEEFPYSSASPEFKLDPVPQGLKPLTIVEANTARLEGVPFQSKSSNGAPEEAPFQNKVQNSSSYSGFESDLIPQGLKPAISEEPDTARLEGVPFQNLDPNAPRAGGVSCQNRISAAAAGDVAFQSRVSPASEKTARLVKNSEKIA